MPKFSIKVPHNLTQDDALKRIQGLLGELKGQFSEKISNLSEEWMGNTNTFSFSVMGFSVSGALIVKHSEIEISGNLPLMAIPFKSKIESTIIERTKTLLA